MGANTIDLKYCLIECEVRWLESKLPNNVEINFVTLCYKEGTTVRQIKAAAKAQLETEFKGEHCEVLSVKKVQTSDVFAA